MASLKDIITKAFDEQEEFIGTERQIAWAEDISRKMHDEVVRMLRVISQEHKTGEMKTADYHEAIRRAVVMIKERRAEWFINHRDDPVDYLLSGSPVGFFRK